MRRLYGLAFAFVCALSASAHAADPCDRTCLDGFVDRYLAAVVAHDPGQLPWASRAKFTENGQAIAIGDGLWGTASAEGHYKLYVADPEDGEVGFYGTIFENGTPVLLALRLKIDNRTISEAETIVARGGGGMPSPGKTLEEKGHPRAQFLRTVPLAERMSREDLVRIADSYFENLAGNSGHGSAPFAPTCERWENGTQTTDNPGLMPAAAGGVNIIAMGCEAQQRSGFFPFVTSIRNRRYPVVDRDRGLVLSFAFFEHQGRIKTIHLTNGQTVPSPVKAPMTFEISELFQIDKGNLNQIEAVINTVPYGMISDIWDKR